MAVDTQTHLNDGLAAVALPAWCDAVRVGFAYHLPSDGGVIAAAAAVPSAGSGSGSEAGLGSDVASGSASRDGSVSFAQLADAVAGSGRFAPELWSVCSRDVRVRRLCLSPVVLDVACERHAVPLGGVRSASRSASLVACRRDAAWALRRHLGIPTIDIARLLRRPGKRGAPRHSTVFDMVRAVERSGDRSLFDARAVSMLCDAGARWFGRESKS